MVCGDLGGWFIIVSTTLVKLMFLPTAPYGLLHEYHLELAELAIMNCPKRVARLFLYDATISSSALWHRSYSKYCNIPLRYLACRFSHKSILKDHLVSCCS